MCEVFKAGIEIDRVEDAEDFLTDLITPAGRAAEHLLIENAAVHPPDEHKVRDLGNVDACRKKIDGHGDLRESIVSIGADQLADAVDAPGDFAPQPLGRPRVTTGTPKNNMLGAAHAECSLENDTRASRLLKKSVGQALGFILVA
jgi:hypothetical protein